MIYSVRVNGETGHNNPGEPDYYVPGEPPKYPQVYFNYAKFCLSKGIIRIGWPDTGDLTKPSKTGALAHAYSLHSLPPDKQKYLTTFRDIAVGSTILMPDHANPGDVYIGTVVRRSDEVSTSYHYYHNVPIDPYQCAHRLKVSWDKDRDGSPKLYYASDLGIGKGGFWLKGFQVVDNTRDIDKVRSSINSARVPVLHLKSGHF